MEDTISTVGSFKEQEIPTADINWGDYVLSLFDKNELIECEDGEKRPNVYGLRRVAEVCFGEMLENHSTIIEPPNKNNGYCATAQCSILMYDSSCGRERRFSDVADVSPENCDSKFAKFASATAATKAEARTLRKILRLNLISSEELTPANIKNVSNDNITEIQIIALDIVCKRYNINLIELINSGAKHHNNIKEVNKELADEYMSIINDNTKREELKATLPNIVGYKEWRNMF